jgi:hypothetical protein
MDFKQNMKNYTGVVLILLLVLIFSQVKTFNFFINTYLGRILLIIVLLVASYCNKIFGVVIVFLIIIFFNNMSFTEGMTNNEESQPNSSKENTNHQPNISEGIDKNTKNDEPIVENIVNQVDSSINNDISANTEDFDKNKKSIEGFDIIGTENSIQKGKQSNSIHVNQDIRTIKNISGTDTSSLFNNNYSNF